MFGSCLTMIVPKFQLNVTVSHLQAVTDGNYVCVFSHGDNKLVTTNKMLQPRPANASNMIQCETPESFQLPPIPTGEGEGKRGDVGLCIRIYSHFSGLVCIC